MDKIKITDHQVFSIAAGVTIGSAILVIPSSAASAAKQDAWIAILFSVASGFLEIFLVCFFWRRFPGYSATGIIKVIFGKRLGAILTAAFIFFCFLSDSQVIWYIGNFVTVQNMTETPYYVINLVFCVVIVIAVLYGLEAIARSYEVLINFISALFIISMLLVSPNIKVENLQPVLEKGIVPVLKCSFLLSSFIIFPLVILIGILCTNADNTGKSVKAFIKGYLLGGFLIFIAILFSIMVLGTTITADSQYPVYILAKEINVGVVLTRLEFIVAGVWITTLLAKSIFYFYVGTMSLSGLLGLKDHKKIVMPLGLIILVMSGIVFPDVIYQADWDTYVWPPFAMTYGIFLPVVMLLVFYVKKAFSAREKGD